VALPGSVRYVAPIRRCDRFREELFVLKIKAVALCLLFAAVGVSAPLSAQGRSTAPGATLEAAVVARPASNRAAISAALTSSQAVVAAKRLGMAADELSDRVAALDDASVQQLSNRILVGGASTVVISTTTIIILLLVLILITD
jgi:hypothetical protein